MSQTSGFGASFGLASGAASSTGAGVGLPSDVNGVVIGPSGVVIGPSGVGICAPSGTIISGITVNLPYGAN